MIRVRLQQLPEDSAVGRVFRDGKPYWSLTDHLLDNLRMALTGDEKHPSKPHPDRPMGGGRRLDAGRIADGQRRRRERARAIAAGEIT